MPKGEHKMERPEKKKCIFCLIQKEKREKCIAESKYFFVRYDKFPVNKGHADIVSKKHLVSIFDLGEDEIKDLFQIIKETKKIIDKKFHPDAYNIGVNEGRAAGRTVDHLHIQFIPRYKGDVADPTGGIRNVIPRKGNYLKKK